MEKPPCVLWPNSSTCNQTIAQKRIARPSSPTIDGRALHPHQKHKQKGSHHELNQFPANFVFGGATAAYQVEGETQTHGKGKVAWDDFLKEQGRFSPRPASDFYNQYSRDLELCERFGMNGIRLSIAWSRIFPTGTGEVNPEGVQYYHDLFKCCRAHGVEPLRHASPLRHAPHSVRKRAISSTAKPSMHLLTTPRSALKEFADDVTYWFTFNEIWADATNTYIEGHFPPAVEKANLAKCFQCEHNMMLAHARAVLAFKRGGFSGKIGVIQSLEYKSILWTRIPPQTSTLLKTKTYCKTSSFSTPPLGATTPRIRSKLPTALPWFPAAASRFAKMIFAIMREAAALNDYLGVNYYQSRFLRAYEGKNDLHHNGTGEKGTDRFRLAGVGERINKPGIPTTDWDWIIYPEGLFDLLVRIRLQYPNYKGDLYYRKWHGLQRSPLSMVL